MGHDEFKSGNREDSLTLEDATDLFWWSTIGLLFEIFTFGPLLAAFVDRHI